MYFHQGLDLLHGECSGLLTSCRQTRKHVCSLMKTKENLLLVPVLHVQYNGYWEHPPSSLVCN